MALLEGLPVIAEDLLEGVFVDPLPCGGHRARLYHVLGTEASRFFTLLSPSLPIASPGGAGRIRDLEKGNSYTLELIHPMREGRSPQQIGRKGLSNHRWIVGGKLCLLLNQWGLVVGW